LEKAQRRRTMPCDAKISFGHAEVRFVDTSFIRVHIGDRIKHENII
jgi:hypothetical protein